MDRSYDLTKRKGVHAFSCGQFSSWIEDVNVNNDLCTYSPCTVINSLYWWICLCPSSVLGANRSDANDLPRIQNASSLA